jgi:arylsulfatase A-like enzyme
MTDDAGYADIGSYGAPDIRTPNIDSLARDGVKLRDFYANAMSCTPTRARLVTGRYQQRYGIEFVIPAPGLAGADRRMAPLAHSLPLLMKKNGYATALVGKWHLGYKQEFSHRAHGFDVFFGYKSAAIDYYTHFTTRSGEGAQFVQAQPDLREGDALIEQDEYMTDLITSPVRRIHQPECGTIVLAATATAAPPDARLEGINLFPVLERKAPQVERTLFWRTAGPSPVNMNPKAVRSGDWTLMIDGAVSRSFLFNVKADRGERQDWFARRQDIAQRLQHLLTEWERDVDAEARAFAATLQ